MSFKTVVIDDELRALTLVSDYVTKVPSLDLVAAFQNAIEALEYLNNHTVDILLLDIQMPDITGLELLDSLEEKPLVIFTTAYPEYAVDGFQLSAIDYLVKPIMFPRFLKAVNKAINQIKLIKQSDETFAQSHPSEPMLAPKPVAGYIFIKIENHWKRVQLCDITYIEANGDYIAIHLVDNKKYLSLQTLTQMMLRVSGKDFVRVHRSYIVNLQQVDTVEKDHLFIADKDITIGKSYRPNFLKLVGKN